MPHVSADQILSFRAPLPPYDTQHTLANRLDREFASISRATQAIRHQICLMRERRQALITSAVTGESYFQ